MGFSYNFFSVKANTKEISLAQHTSSMTLNFELNQGDLISGKLFYAYDHEDTFYFFEVIFLSCKNDVYICRTRRTNSRRAKHRKKMLVRSSYSNTSGIILRKIPNSKFSRKTKTKPNCRYYFKRAA